MVPGPAVGELSQDQWWFWDGVRWIPAVSPDGQWRWDGMRWAPAANPGAPAGYTGYPAVVGYAAPPPPGPAPGVVYAGFGPRLGAYAVDSLITGVPATAVVFAAMWPQIRDAFDRASRGEPAGTTLVGPPAWVSLLFAALSALYFTGQWALWSRTLGMRVTRCRVVRELDGGAPTFDQAVRRGVFFWGPSAIGWIPVVGVLAGLVAVIGMLIAFGDSRKQGWPDKLAKTFVVRPYP